MIRLHAIVRGEVQGVGYRASCAAEATRLGLTGWVRNLADGAVELEAQGIDVDRLVRWCRLGPPAATVTEVVTAPRAVLAGETGFTIRRA